RSEAQERRYYVLHKPAGVVCTNEPRETRPRAIDLVTDARKGRIFTVGRLDEESKGLLLLTTDGEFAERIAHPRYGVTKTYLVRTQGKITDEAVQRVREGVHLSEGRTAGARILVKRRTPSGSSLEVTIQEGRNREVRRVFARVGYKVVSLVRTSIGPLTIRGLKEGHWRALSRDEVEALLAMSRGPGDARVDEVEAEPERETFEPEPSYRPRRSGGRGPRGRGRRRRR
ncbi:MAG: pseudouridine synthase, partial [Planctomycetota bacterium]